MAIAVHVALLPAMWFQSLTLKGEKEMEEKLNTVSNAVSDADL